MSKQYVSLVLGVILSISQLSALDQIGQRGNQYIDNVIGHVITGDLRANDLEQKLNELDAEERRLKYYTEAEKDALNQFRQYNNAYRNAIREQGFYAPENGDNRHNVVRHYDERARRFEQFALELEAKNKQRTLWENRGGMAGLALLVTQAVVGFWFVVLSIGAHKGAKINTTNIAGMLTDLKKRIIDGSLVKELRSNLSEAEKRKPELTDKSLIEAHIERARGMLVGARYAVSMSKIIKLLYRPQSGQKELADLAKEENETAKKLSYEDQIARLESQFEDFKKEIVRARNSRIYKVILGIVGSILFNIGIDQVFNWCYRKRQLPVTVPDFS